jgi:hypothetical protein
MGRRAVSRTDASARKPIGSEAESTRRRTHIRYRPGFAPPQGGNRVPGGTETQSADYATTFELPENVPIRESELRAVELLLGSALRDICVQDADDARKDGGVIDNEPQSAAQ